MDPDKKLELLKELDSSIDWQKVARDFGEISQASNNSAKQQIPGRKLTKAEKKRSKLNKQREQVEETMRRKNIKTIVFDNPDVKSTPEDSQTSRNDSSAKESTQGIEIDLDKARHEIVKFGMQSLTAKDLEDAEAALAIRLGARPNKAQAVNYKQLQIQRRKERAEAKEMEATMMKPKLNRNLKKKPGGSTNRGKQRPKEHFQKGGRASGRNSTKPGRHQRDR